MFSRSRVDNAGVSPVIAVILMVAVTVILSAVIGSFVLDVGGSISANPQAGVTFSTVGGTVTVQAVSMDNADSLSVRAPDGTEAGTIDSVGKTVDVSAASGESVTVIGSLDGKEAVVQSFTKDATTASGGAPSDISAVAFDGGDGTEANPYVIMKVQQLQAMNNDLDAHYILGQNIDASGTNSWNSGDGFNPIGNNTDKFIGRLDGDDYIIDGLYINRPSTDDVGLLGFSQGNVTNIGVINVGITGNRSTGGLVGNNGGAVTSSYSTGSINSTGFGTVGGLVGNNGGAVTSSYSTGSVNSDEYYAGGLVGYNAGTVSDSYATGDVTAGKNYVGGLVGDNFGGTVEDSHSTGSVNGVIQVGGLVGRNYEGIVEDSYSTGSVNGDEVVGGLVGYNAASKPSLGSNVTSSYSTGNVNGDTSVGGLVGNNRISYVDYSYSTGNVNGGSEIGGLVGDNSFKGTVTSSYSTGSVSGNDSVGGLVGVSVNQQFSSLSGTVEDSYWDTESSAQSSSEGGTGLTTSDMQGDSYDAGFESIIVDDPAFTGITGDYPELAWQSE